MKNILYIGGDERNIHIYDTLKNKFENSDIIAFKDKEYDKEKIANAEIIILPILSSKDSVSLYSPLYEKTIKIDEMLSDIKKAKAIIGGRIDLKTKEFAQRNKIRCIEYIELENFKSLNAIPTAEAALSIAILNTNKTIWRSKCLVAGYGCIGKYLCFLLQALGAEVTASARKEKDFNELKRKNINFINTSDINTNLENFDIIFNTIPHRIFQEEKIKELKEDTLLIDLASAPYGINHENNKDYKCKIMLSSSLPGIYSPKTAAKITTDVLEDILKEVLEYV